MSIAPVGETTGGTTKEIMEQWAWASKVLVQQHQGQPGHPSLFEDHIDSHSNDIIDEDSAYAACYIE